MREKLIAALVIGLLNGPVWAGEVVIRVVNGAGRPVQNAVAALTPDEPTERAAKVPGPPKSAVIDQNNETFIPLVTVLQQGGRLIFRNSDTTLHHVYSFSQIKQFQFALNPGQVSPPVVFDKEGVAAIGCNIHDHMIAYLYAAVSPWTAVSDVNGEVRFTAVPAGKSHVEIWHPALAPGLKPIREAIDVGAETTELSVGLSLAAPSAHGQHQMDY